ncbi:MAG: hypothetical protein IPJ74_05575 [Saprospiraceae bacterium]|nr:hypothetical protein [Saprospiraceae bacterium]
MKNNKLIRLLAGFSRREMTRFKEYVFSPYFNKHEEVRALTDYLSEIFPNFDLQHCQREVLFQHLYPGEAHDQSRLALVFAYTMRLLEDFLAQEQLQQGTTEQQERLLRALRLKKQYKLYEKILQKTEQYLAEVEKRDYTHYYQEYRLAAEADLYYNQIERRKMDHNIQRKQNNLDAFYILEKLRDACEMQVRRRILNVDYSARMLETVVEEVQANASEYAREPLILIYYSLYKMSTSNEKAYYYSVLDALQNYEYRFSNTELVYIYNYLQNYCIQQINRGEGQFLQEIFKLYQAQLVQGLLIEDGYLSEWHYKNIITVGIRLNEMDWVKDFIENYKKDLSPEAQENAYRFNRASYHYAMQEFNEVLQLLLQVEYSDLRYSLGAKALLLRTYYDLEEYDALISLAQSFSLYLRRNKLLADSNREGHHNLFKFTRRTAQIRAKLGYETDEKLHKQLVKLQEDIIKAGAIFNKAWLLEKVNELETMIVV